MLVLQILMSKVWLYAKKSDNGEQTACQLCNYTCPCHSHSTSTIRQHLITKHNKIDLILKSSRAPSQLIISQALKQELHQLCYSAIIKDGCPFNDLNKSGITALINKSCPGIFFIKENTVVVTFLKINWVFRNKFITIAFFHWPNYYLNLNNLILLFLKEMNS